MPVRHVIDKDRRLVVSTGEGRVIFPEILAHQDALRADPDFNPEFYQLIDGTAVTSIDVSVDEIMVLVSRAIFSPASRRAFVAPSAFVYGMARMMGTYLEMSKTASQVAIFHDLPSALQWLGLEALPNAMKPETAGDGKAQTSEDEKIA